MICPLFYIAYLISGGSSPNPSMNCIGARCKWWDSAMGCCKVENL